VYEPTCFVLVIPFQHITVLFAVFCPPHGG